MAELDPTPANYAQLKTELANARYNGTTGAEAAVLLNDFSSLDTLADRSVIPAWEVMGAVVHSEWDARWTAWTAAQRAWFEYLVSGGIVNAASQNVRDKLGALFPQGSAPLTRAALLALTDRKCSRAEKLFGAGAKVAFFDVDRARALT